MDAAQVLASELRQPRVHPLICNESSVAIDLVCEVLPAASPGPDKGGQHAHSQSDSTPKQLNSKMMPAAVSCPVQQRDSLPGQSKAPLLRHHVCEKDGRFSWQDPCGTPGHESKFYDVPQDAMSIPPLCTSTSIEPDKVAAPAVGEEVLDFSLESLAAPRDLHIDFEDVTSSSFGPSFQVLVGDEVGIDAGASSYFQLLEEQILRFRQDNEALARLRKQAELAEAELAQEREVLRGEVEEERAALRNAIEHERQALRRERSRIELEAETKRRAAAVERLELREHLDELREELKNKEHNWQRSVDRLQRQVDELSRKNRELLDVREVPSRAERRQAHIAHTRSGSRHRGQD